jgi:hypothetical protein
MKVLKNLTVFSLFLSLTIIYSCADVSGGDKEAKEKVQVAKTELDEANKTYQDELEAYRAKIHERITFNDRMIAELNKDISRSKGKSKEGYEQSVESLEKRNAELKAKLKEFKGEKDSDWDKFKKDFSREVDELSESINALVKKVGDELKQK